MSTKKQHTLLRDQVRMDRSAFSVGRLSDEHSDLDYWLSRPPEERWAAVELMRQINYDYDPSTARIQSVIEVTQRT